MNPPKSAPHLTALALIALLSLTAIGIATPASAQPGPDRASSPARGVDQCFRSNDLQSWRALDDKTMYIRVNMNDYYRIEMSGECSELTSPDPHLITVVRGSNEICGPLDWDLKVADGTGPGSFAVPCIVKSQTRLTPAEVAAIPKKFKP
jgi:hypothetical protein